MKNEFTLSSISRSQTSTKTSMMQDKEKIPKIICNLIAKINVFLNFILTRLQLINHELIKINRTKNELKMQE